MEILLDVTTWICAVFGVLLITVALIGAILFMLHRKDIKDVYFGKSDWWK